MPAALGEITTTNTKKTQRVQRKVSGNNHYEHNEMPAALGSKTLLIIKTILTRNASDGFLQKLTQKSCGKIERKSNYS